ncbi:MAG: AMP-binding protein, partial [Anaerolineaceae bacterium]|nr:AMP-binding protein [Anaerolineaceae bacterium]
MTHKPWLKHYEPGVPPTLEYPQEPVFHFLEETARKYPHNACTVFQDKMISYQQMDVLSNILAAAIVDMGVHKGDRVALFMPNLPQFVLAFFATLKAGGTVVAINPTYKEREILFQLNDSGAVMLIGLSSAQSLLETIQPQTNVRQMIFSEIQDAFELPALAEKGASTSPEAAGSSVDPDSGDHLTLLDLLAHYSGAERPDVGVTGDDVAIFQYSGGTTGVPKAAIGLHRNLVANIIQFRHLLRVLKEGEQTFI